MIKVYCNRCGEEIHMGAMVGRVSLSTKNSIFDKESFVNEEVKGMHFCKEAFNTFCTVDIEQLHSSAIAFNFQFAFLKAIILDKKAAERQRRESEILNEDEEIIF